ncbi:MAG: class I SAM-dependent methyltransferase [Opitutales bacterium]|nr:class I SAM-dependent methyltransferase [Opitutales bacterium]
MKIDHYKEYFSSRFDLEIKEEGNGEVLTGMLVEKDGDESAKKVPIVRGIPRFVPESNYADNFGLQWNKYKSTQLDSASGLSLTAKRFWENTNWTKDELRGKRVLEVGSGAGRFSEIFLGTEAELVSFDYSCAVDANLSSNGQKGDFLLFQGDLYDIPFDDESFDFVFCYGVLQHTPDPLKAYDSIFRKLKSGGKISIDYYRKFESPNSWSTPKYLWRPITSKMNPKHLLNVIKFYVPLYLPFDTFLKRKFKNGYNIAAYIPIPIWNYLTFGLSEEQRKEWAIMDTFDALGARYDYPKTLEEIREMVASEENHSESLFYGSNGIVANIEKK